MPINKHAIGAQMLHLYAPDIVLNMFFNADPASNIVRITKALA